MKPFYHPKYENHEQLMRALELHQYSRMHYSYLMQTLQHLPVSPQLDLELSIYNFLWSWHNWRLQRARLARANVLGDKSAKSTAMSSLNSSARLLRESYAELKDAKAAFRRSKFRLVKSA